MSAPEELSGKRPCLVVLREFPGLSCTVETHSTRSRQSFQRERERHTHTFSLIHIPSFFVCSFPPFFFFWSITDIDNCGINKVQGGGVWKCERGHEREGNEWRRNRKKKNEKEEIKECSEKRRKEKTEHRFLPLQQHTEAIQLKGTVKGLLMRARHTHTQLRAFLQTLNASHAMEQMSSIRRN